MADTRRLKDSFADSVLSTTTLSKAVTVRVQYECTSLLLSDIKANSAVPPSLAKAAPWSIVMICVRKVSTADTLDTDIAQHIMF